MMLIDRKLRGAAIAAGTLAALFTCLSPVPEARAADEVVAGQALVRFERGASAQTRSAARSSVGATVTDALSVDRLQLLDLPNGASVAGAVAELGREPGVAYAEPNRRLELRLRPNDTLFGSLWGLENGGQPVPVVAAGITSLRSGTPDADIDAPEAWDLTTGSPAVTVAIGDSGIDRLHPDLAANVDPRSADLLDRDGDPADSVGHGTQVAGIIGAHGNDARGVAGVSWSVRLMALRLGDARGLTTAAAVESFAYASARGVPIYNGSFGHGVASRAELDAIGAAPRTLFVFATNNGGRDSDATGDYPCAYPSPNIVCVAASTQDDRLAPFSNYGRVSVDLAAPGQGIWSTTPGGGYGMADGTSFAAPHVAGVAALYLARHPGATVADVRRALLAGADVRPAFSALASGGRLNARATLDVAPAAVPAPPAPAVAVAARSATSRRASLSVTRSQRLATVLRAGLRPRVSCPHRCRVTAHLRLDRRAAARLGLPRTLARGSRRLRRGGSVGVTLRPVISARRLRRVLGRRLTLTVAVVHPDGTREALTRTIVLAARARSPR